MNLPYDALEKELETMCEVLGIDMNIKPLPLSASAFIKQNTVETVCREYKVSQTVAKRWRRELGISGKRNSDLDYSIIDPLIREGLSVREIMSRVGCSKFPVVSRRVKLGLSRPKRPRKDVPVVDITDHDNQHEKTVPPEDRAALIVERKLRRFSPEHRAAWIGGLAYRQTLEGVAVNG